MFSYGLLEKHLYHYNLYIVEMLFNSTIVGENVE